MSLSCVAWKLRRRRENPWPPKCPLAVPTSYAEIEICMGSGKESANILAMNHLHPKRARKAVSWLSVLTPAAAILSVINVTISISTSVWLKTSEQIFVDSSNSTVLRSEVPRTKRTVSGLWKLCEYHNLNLLISGALTRLSILSGSPQCC
ncbi:unnamed protein product [Allacma fusca]|uniref:Uncharacterized protein n=1 Tax=Allacma fusca TaxID=39272 RepID=A0A8J2LB34_9HEXA|nr:unnamed protein product [Allacma fusca]